MQVLVTDRIIIMIDNIAVHSGDPGNKDADHQANMARDSSANMKRELLYTLASNRARDMSKGWSAAKAQWEADMYRKHFSY